VTHLPAYKPEDVLRKLRRIGFAIDHVTGSHYILRHSDGHQALGYQAPAAVYFATGGGQSTLS
jgi:hypothetical protein